MLRAVLLSLAGVVLTVAPTAGQAAPHRELSFDVDQVTHPDVAAFPDGSLLFTLLGHLYRIPADGGEAVQLTWGPYFHKEPAVSPDGRWIAVVSDRDFEGGDNLYLLDADGDEPRRLTDEVEGGRPAWSPDGARLAYLSYTRERPMEEWRPIPPAQIKELDLRSGAVRDITEVPADTGALTIGPDGPPRTEVLGDIRDVTYGPDGALLWVSVRSTEDCPRCFASDVHRRSAAEEVEVVATLDGVVDQLRVRPEGIFYTVTRSDTRRREWVVRPAFDGDDRTLGFGDVRRSGPTASRFAVAPEGSGIYVGDWGQLWAIDGRWTTRRRIPFTARVTQTVLEGASPPEWTPPEEAGSFPVSIVSRPALSPDGRELAFAAAGSLWRRPVGNPDAPPTPIGTEPATDLAYAPTGDRMAYVRRGIAGDDELVVLDGWEDEGRVVARGRLHTPSFSPDGESVTFTESRRVGVVPAAGGEVEWLTGFAWYTPHWTRDESWVAAFRVAFPLEARDLMRIPLDAPDQPIPLTDFQEQIKEPLISNDGRWLVFGRNADLWMADLEAALADDGLVTEGEARMLVPGGGLSFSFDPRGDAVVFASGARILRATLPDGIQEEISAPFTLEAVAPGALVVRNVRVLDPAGEGFSPTTDVYVDGNRIVALGAPPPGFDGASAEVVDGSGRFAVPGLWDAHLHGGEVNEHTPWIPRGITVQRDPGTEIVEALQELDYVAAQGAAAVPRRFTSGEIFEGYDDMWWGRWHRVTNPDEARRLVDLWADLGVRFIKVYHTMPWSLHRAVAREAAARGLPVVGHGTNPEEMIRSMTLGYRSLEHALYPGIVHDDVLRLMAATETFWVPQYTQLGVHNALALQDPEGFSPGVDRLSLDEAPPIRFRSVEESLGPWLMEVPQIRRAQELGVKLIPGTDNAGGPGWVHVELEAFQSAGFTPAEVIRMATYDAAAVEGVEDQMGTLEVGKLADLLLLDQDPLLDVRNLRDPWAVILGGRLVHLREDADRRP